MSDFDSAELAAIAPYARGHVRRERRWWLVLGGLLLALGIFGASLVGVAAGPRDQPLMLISIFVFVAILPGAALFGTAVRWPTKHPLVRALEREPQRLHTVSYTYMKNIEGDYLDVVRVELKTGRSFVFAVPPSIVPHREPHLKRQTA